MREREGGGGRERRDVYMSNYLLTKRQGFQSIYVVASSKSMNALCQNYCTGVWFWTWTFPLSSSTVEDF